MTDNKEAVYNNYKNLSQHEIDEHLYLLQVNSYMAGQIPCAG